MNRTADTARKQLAARLNTTADDVLDDDGRGHGAENDPETDGGDTDGLLQVGQRGSRVKIFKGGVGHEIEDALRNERSHSPTQRPQEDTDKIQQVTAADLLECWNRHEADEQGRKRVTHVQDDFLEDVAPEHHQRSQLADEPEDGGDDEVGGVIVELRHDIPPGRLRGRVALDDEQLVELLINLGRINAQSGENGALQQTLECVAPGGQEHEQRGQQQQAHQQIQQRTVRESVRHCYDDADDEKGVGHAQQQGMEPSAVGEKRGKDAVERGHDERTGLELLGGEHGRRVEQLELRRVIADGFLELGILLFGQCQNLFLLVVPVLDVLHQRRIRGLV